MKLITKNRRAYFEYFVDDIHMAGIQLKGSEVKAIKAGKVNVSEAYCIITNSEVFIKNMHVSHHDHGGTHNNHQEFRDRKLLLKKKEILKLHTRLKVKGISLIPLAILVSETGYIKIELGLCKGKKLHDKKQAIKLKDLDREIKNEI